MSSPSSKRKRHQHRQTASPASKRQKHSSPGQDDSAILSSILDQLDTSPQQSSAAPAAKPKHSYNYGDFEQTLQASQHVSQQQQPQPQQHHQQQQPSYGQPAPYSGAQPHPTEFRPDLPLNQITENGKRNRDERCTAFVENVPPNVSRDELKRHFVSCGPVESAVIALDRVTNESKGHAYINFFNPESVENAVTKLDGSVFKGAKLKVTPKSGSLITRSTPNRNLPLPGARAPMQQSKPIQYGNSSYSQQQKLQQQQFANMANSYNHPLVNKEQQKPSKPVTTNLSNSEKASSKESESKSDHKEKHLKDEFIGASQIKKKSEKLFDVNMHCSNPDHTKFFKERISKETNFQLKRHISKKSFDKWYASNKKHVRVMELRSGVVQEDYQELINQLKNEHCMYVASESLKGCIVLASSLKGYPTSQPVIGIFVRSSGRKK